MKLGRINGTIKLINQRSLYDILIMTTDTLTDLNLNLRYEFFKLIFK